MSGIKIKIDQVKSVRDDGAPVLEKTMNPIVKKLIWAEIEKTDDVVPRFADALAAIDVRIVYDPDGIINRETGNQKGYTNSMYMPGWNIIVLDDPGINVSFVHEAAHALDVWFGNRYGILFSSLVLGGGKYPKHKIMMEMAEEFATTAHYLVGHMLHGKNKLNQSQKLVFDTQRKMIPEDMLDLFRAHTLMLIYFSVQPPENIDSANQLLRQIKLIS